MDKPVQYKIFKIVPKQNRVDGEGEAKNTKNVTTTTTTGKPASQLRFLTLVDGQRNENSQFKRLLKDAGTQTDKIKILIQSQHRSQSGPSSSSSSPSLKFNDRSLPLRPLTIACDPISLSEYGQYIHCIKCYTTFSDFSQLVVHFKSCRTTRKSDFASYKTRRKKTNRKKKNSSSSSSDNNNTSVENMHLNVSSPLIEPKQESFSPPPSPAQFNEDSTNCDSTNYTHENLNVMQILPDLPRINNNTNNNNNNTARCPREIDDKVWVPASRLKAVVTSAAAQVNPPSENDEEEEQAEEITESVLPVQQQVLVKTRRPRGATNWTKNYKCTFEGCKFVEIGFRSPGILLAHIASHRREKQRKGVKCKSQNCGALLKTQKEVKKHQTMHREEERAHLKAFGHKCGDCDRVYRSGRALGIHRKKHAPIEVRTCPYPECGQVFCSSGYVKRHVQIVHEKLKPLMCERCPKRFSRPEALADHLRTHTNERPYLCSLCGATFGLRTGLRRHQIVHTKIKRFSCDYCGKRFTGNQMRRRHMSSQKCRQSAGVGEERQEETGPTTTEMDNISTNATDSISDFNLEQLA